MESSCPRIAVRRTASLPLAYVPAIHVLIPDKTKTWMAGTSPAMTTRGSVSTQHTPGRCPIFLVRPAHHNPQCTIRQRPSQRLGPHPRAPRIQTSRSSFAVRIARALPFRGSAQPWHSVMSGQHARVDELHSRIGCQPILDALFPRSPGRHHAANLPACALSRYNLGNPRTIIGHWAFD
jgi:hypothetical protein